ncbi:hypothetical protein OGAPHI_001246 [Ogataea philodendri]|uniref:Plus3 domain-containing protein n=1 Tax=Ogataea philodendri TaxID=1378263 RepID=A0A9P8TA50_9ASCO|nr:uncharacterized protein OGAPHI_001246 [Ogataea philodendri]KAH3670731.1 hypothetical protein OGAPHI_001246 [Ogataea philodendri]
MSDSDDDLLALAGMGSEGEESDYEPTLQTTSRTSGLKRKTVDDDEDDEDDESKQDPYPLEGKFKDEEDKAALLSMDEVTREQVLYDREQEREKYRERRYLALRARQSQAESSALKTAEPTGKKLRTSKLHELKKQREKKTRKTQRADSEDEDMEDTMAAEEDEEDDYEEGYYSDEVESRQRKSHTSDYDDKYYQDATLKDVNSKVRSSRTILSRFLFRDEFDQVIRNTFVRVNVGVSRETGQSQYRMAKIEEVKRGGKPYHLLNKPCDTYLVVSQGDSKKLIDMKCLSDSPISPSEFESYKRRLEDSSLELPSLGDVDAKFRELRDMSTRKLTDEDINKMVARKEAISVATMDSGNRVKRLARLREELQVAVEREDLGNVERLTKQIDELSKYVHADSGELSRMDKINLRNKKTNETAIRRAEKKNVESRQKQLLSNNFNDPFSRLRTNPKIFYTSAQSAQKEIADEQKPTEDTKEDAEQAARSSLFMTNGIDSVIKEVTFDFKLEV